MSKTFVITGTSHGIGLEMVRQLSEKGQRICALARNPKKSQALMELKSKYAGQISLFDVDVTSDEDVQSFLKDLKDDTVVDVLINNAGIYGANENFEDLSLDDIQRTFATNALGPMRLTRALLPYLRKAENPKVIHITSVMGSIADNSGGGSYGYRISKAALNMFHKSFSVEFPDVMSLVIHPGWVKTKMGGPQAPLEPASSVSGILSVIDKATHKDSGKFLDYNGNELPW